jgi:hypothetical protein
MERDMDLIRDLLLDMERGQKVFEVRSDSVSRALGSEEIGMSTEEADKLDHHFGLLQEKGLVEFRRSGGGAWTVTNITWEGHDFIDSVRDPELWAQTKQGVTKAGGFTFDVIKAVAKGLLKKKIEQHTGVDIDL